MLGYPLELLRYVDDSEKQRPEVCMKKIGSLSTFIMRLSRFLIGVLYKNCRYCRVYSLPRASKSQLFLIDAKCTSISGRFAGN